MNHPQLAFALLIFCAVILSRPATPQPAHPVADDRSAISTGINRELRIFVGPPDATLAVWTLEPDKGAPVRGTVLLLHGFLSNHQQVHGAGMALRNAGYRAVLVDLRGFGASSGEQITFGSLDAQDMTQLVDALQKLGLCGRTVGVFGTSYGAASAILHAAQDPRVSAVVAVAPFAEIRGAVPPFTRFVLGGLESLFSDNDLQGAANAVASMTRLDLDAARPLEAIRQTRAQVLLIHGDADSVVPCEASRQLHGAAPRQSSLMLVPGRGHLDLCFDFGGELHAPTQQWFDEYLAPRRTGP